MRLPSPLYKMHKGRMFKDVWKVKSNRNIVELPISQILIEKGVKIWDAKEVANPPPILETIPIPEPWTPPQPNDKTHPQWKPQLCRICDRRTRLLEGLQQAQLLTNTLVYEGLPENLQIQTSVIQQADQDELLKRQILHSHAYDGWQVRLPKRIDMNKPGWIFARDYGTPLRRKIDLLVQNIVRLMFCQSGMYSDIMKRNVLRHLNAVITEKRNGDLLQFSARADILISSYKPLSPFVSMEEVKNENSSALPNIYPVHYTIDLIPTHIYEVMDIYPIVKKSEFPFLHTIYMIDTEPIYKWTMSNKLAKALITCYTFAVSQAKQLYGDKQLPTPVAVQCVITDGRKFSLLAYQLNTANSDTDIKNMAWIKSEMALYDICKEEAGKIQFAGYNSDVYQNLLLLHLNGTDLTDQTLTRTIMPTQNHQFVVKN